MSGARQAVTAWRRGACPTLAAPMPTGDGLLARLRPREPALPLGMVRTVLLAADRHGSGLVEITARGSLQVRGLTARSAADFADDVAQSGFPLAEAPAVEISPLSGLDRQALADGQAMAQRLRAVLAEEEAGSSGFTDRLAPKLSIVIDEGGQVDLSGLIADLRLVAEAAERWRLFLGAQDAGLFDAQGAVVAVRASLRALAQLGRAARGRDLDPATLTLPALEAATPEKPAEPENELGAETGALQGQGRAPEMKRGSARQSPRPEAVTLVGPIDLGPINFRSGDPMTRGFALGLGFAFGQARAADLLTFLQQAEAEGAAELRLAPDHGLIVAPLGEAALRRLMARAEALGFITRPDNPARAVAACAGRPACASACLDTKGIAAQAAERLAPLLDGSVRLHVSGCPKGCAHPRAAALTLVGGPAQERLGLVLEGQAADAPSIALDVSDLNGALTRLSRCVSGARLAGESARACLRRLGPAGIAAALQQG
ncbi:precorrin-3B synthase [Rhizobium rhizosphaerae]|nr:precorrin-3B synthase [Xaviernesmea rhizosphaerae]